MAKHFLDLISLQFFNMVDMRWVPWTLHSYEWSFYGP